MHITALCRIKNMLARLSTSSPSLTHWWCHIHIYFHTFISFCVFILHFVIKLIFILQTQTWVHFLFLSFDLCRKIWVSDLPHTHTGLTVQVCVCVLCSAGTCFLDQLWASLWHEGHWNLPQTSDQLGRHVCAELHIYYTCVFFSELNNPDYSLMLKVWFNHQ